MNDQKLCKYFIYMFFDFFLFSFLYSEKLRNTSYIICKRHFYFLCYVQAFSFFSAICIESGIISSEHVSTDSTFFYLLPQSRQSAKRFSSRWNWDSPTPLAAGEWAPPPFGTGGGHTRLRLKGWGSPNSNEGTYTVVLYIYKYFVFITHQLSVKLFFNLCMRLIWRGWAMSTTPSGCFLQLLCTCFSAAIFSHNSWTFPPPF